MMIVEKCSESSSEIVRKCSEAEAGRRGLGVQGKGAAAPLPLLPLCRRKDHGPLPLISATLNPLGLSWRANLPEPGFLDSGSGFR